MEKKVALTSGAVCLTEFQHIK